MKATMIITLFALIFTIAASQSRMRPTDSTSAQSGSEIASLEGKNTDFVIDVNIEPLTADEHETHDYNYIYGRSKFIDVDVNSSDFAHSDQEDSN